VTARAHFVTYALDGEGRPVAGATITVYDPDTTNVISETMYAEDDPDVTTLSNPFTADADGRIEFFLAIPKRVDILVHKTGYDDKTITADAIALTANDLTILDAGTPMTQRAGLNFTHAAFVLADDAGNDETEVTLNIGLDADIVTQDFGDAADSGATGKLADAGHTHGMPADPVTAHEAAGNPHPTYLTAAEGDAAYEVAGAVAAHTGDATDAHDASAISIADAGGNFTATDVEAALAEEADARQAHEGDTTDAHDASAVSVADSGGNFAATNVETALAELADEAETHEASLNIHHSRDHEPTRHLYVGALIALTANDSIPNNSTNEVDWAGSGATEIYDSDSLVASGDFEVPASFVGKWRVKLHAVFAIPSNPGDFEIQVIAGSQSFYSRLRASAAPVAGQFPTIDAEAVLTLAESDGVTFQVFQNSGAAVNLLGDGTTAKTFFELEYKGV
jgi:hypothetical protein